MARFPARAEQRRVRRVVGKRNAIFVAVLSDTVFPNLNFSFGVGAPKTVRDLQAPLGQPLALPENSLAKASVLWTSAVSCVEGPLPLESNRWPRLDCHEEARCLEQAKN